ncbi:hypothetical protein CHH38_13260 [Acinetobacter nosocomialis]|jgi:hypothetical protein|nr:hypothetical protein CHH38_13260 [Acinetobacter nosocomialis]PNN10457.1 caspase family protein [Acinetobacter sp. FDAARGOS_131]SSR13811.1 Caspase domain [Acinetobacter nosocomialis]SSR42757.1 Caspase domain [Acinetobacter baumannii]
MREIMISRKALIIGSPDKKIPGVNIDTANMNSFLKSAIGGAWKESEIINLTNPSKNIVISNINQLEKYDYSFVFFAGHGYYSTSKDCTVISINRSETLDSTLLRKGSPKHTLILDCCRELVDEQNLNEAAFESMVYDSATTQYIDIQECRKYFDKKIKESNLGLVVMNSCDLNEYAGENEKRGGYYTSSLIKSARDWADKKLVTINLQKNYATYSTKKSHDSASTIVKRLSADRQNPVYEGPRSDSSFPFTIVA